MAEILNENSFTLGKLVVPENTLKQKVGNGGFNETVLAKAQDNLDKNDIDFRPMATEYLTLLNDVLKGIKSGELLPEEEIDQIMFPVMQLRAQGSLFKYPSITKISHILIDCLETIKVTDRDVLDIIEAYKKSGQAMIALQIKDENNKAAKELCDALAGACARYEKIKPAKM